MKGQVRAARPQDTPALTSLLAQAGLPREGLDDCEGLFVLDEGGAVVGAVGFEREGTTALVRSLVVRPDARSKGAGRVLLDHALAEIQALAVAEAYALTTTIADWLARLGWREVARRDVPAALWRSAELRGACPDAARVFKLRLARAPR